MRLMMTPGVMWMTILGKKFNIMKQIKELIFGRCAEPVCQVKEGYRTIYPENPPAEQEWREEFKVGMMYDRKIVHID